MRGRCVDFDTGLPLPRCRVQLTGHESTGYPMAWERGDWADPAESTTGPEGTFRFEVRLPAANEEVDRGRYHLRISHPEHASWFSHCALVVAAANGGIDYGDVRLPEGVWPRIRCEDAAKVPQPGLLLELRRVREGGADNGFVTIQGDGPHSWVETSAYERTDIDGYLHLPNPVPPGDYTLAVLGRDAVDVPAKITLPSAERILVVVAPLDPRDAIRGRLVDAAGLPVEGALLGDDDDRGNQCVTRRDGAFTLVATRPPKGAAATIHMAQSRRFDPWIALGDVEWGRENVELTVPTHARHVFVVRSARGAPVEDVNLYCLPRGGAAMAGVRMAGSFVGGRAECRLPSGAYDLLVVPRNDRMRASGWQTIAVDSARAQIDVSLPEAVARTVGVRFADDRSAAAGVLVEAIVDVEPSPFAWVRPKTVVDRQPQSPKPWLVASARTDASGRATLQLGETALVYLRICGPGVRTEVRAVDLTNGNAVATIDVERGAVLSGTVGPVAALQALDPNRKADVHPSIYAYYGWTTPRLTIVYGPDHQRREGVRLDRQGHFRCEGLPPGPVEVQLRRWLKEGQGNLLAPPVLLGRTTLRADPPTAVELQLPAELSGR